MNHPAEAVEEPRQHEHRWADDAAVQAEKGFADFRKGEAALARGDLHDASRRRLDVLVKNMRSIHLRNIQ